MEDHKVQIQQSLNWLSYREALLYYLFGIICVLCFTAYQVALLFAPVVPK